MTKKGDLAVLEVSRALQPVLRDMADDDYVTFANVGELENPKACTLYFHAARRSNTNLHLGCERSICRPDREADRDRRDKD